MIRGFLFAIEFFQCFDKMDEDQWMYDNIRSEEVDMNEEQVENGSCLRIIIKQTFVMTTRMLEGMQI